MWISADGRLNTVVIPTENFSSGGELDEKIASLAIAELVALDELLETIAWGIYEEVQTLTIDPEEESTYKAEGVPSDLLAGLDWDALLGSSTLDKLNEIDLRWRMDVVAIIQQAITERLPG